MRLIGYWRSEFDPLWRDVRDFVDLAWPTATRSMVAAYLSVGLTLEQYRGLSPCRVCGKHNGSKELTDGTFCWPEGLFHYVSVHDVGLPDEFVAHVQSSPGLVADNPLPDFDHLGQRVRGGPYDEDYVKWNAQTIERSLAGAFPADVMPNWLNATIDDEWWLQYAAPS